MIFIIFSSALLYLGKKTNVFINTLLLLSGGICLQLCKSFFVFSKYFICIVHQLVNKRSSLLTISRQC